MNHIIHKYELCGKEWGELCDIRGWCSQSRVFYGELMRLWNIAFCFTQSPQNNRIDKNGEKEKERQDAVSNLRLAVSSYYPFYQRHSNTLTL